MNGQRIPEDTLLRVSIGDLGIELLAPGQREESGDRISFWWGLTSAAVALSRHLAGLGDLHGERVVELGCGLGLGGVTAALLGASVTFTDYMPEALECARNNCLLNHLDMDRTLFVRLDWEDPPAGMDFTMVIGSEIAYDYFTHGALIKLMETATKPYGRIILAERKRLAVSRFVGRMRGRGFDCSETRYRLGSDLGLPSQETTIFTLDRCVS